MPCLLHKNRGAFYVIHLLNCLIVTVLQKELVQKLSLQVYKVTPKTKIIIIIICNRCGTLYH